MKIIEVSRTVSGSNYSNLSARAVVEEMTETIATVGLALDKELRKALEKIDDSRNQEAIARREANETVDLLQKAIDFAKKSADLPF